jgi:hypothetical protein
VFRPHLSALQPLPSSIWAEDYTVINVNPFLVFFETSVMYAPNPQHLLHYKISTEPGGVRLRIWELATGPNTQAKAYLYIINHRLRSVAEAQASLRQHLDLNGGLLTPEQEIPARGKIQLLPHPTWDG